MSTRMEKHHPNHVKHSKDSVHLNDDKTLTLSKTEKQQLQELYDRQDTLEVQVNDILQKQTRKKPSINRMLNGIIVIEVILLIIVLGIAFMK